MEDSLLCGHLNIWLFFSFLLLLVAPMNAEILFKSLGCWVLFVEAKMRQNNYKIKDQD